jgi:hypothetical protein
MNSRKKLARNTVNHLAQFEGIIRTCSKEGSFSDFSESDVKWETLELWALYFITPIQSFSNDNYFLPRAKT